MCITVVQKLISKAYNRQIQYIHFDLANSTLRGPTLVQLPGQDEISQIHTLVRIS